MGSWGGGMLETNGFLGGRGCPKTKSKNNGGVERNSEIKFETAGVTYFGEA